MIISDSDTSSGEIFEGCFCAPSVNMTTTTVLQGETADCERPTEIHREEWHGAVQVELKGLSVRSLYHLCKISVRSLNRFCKVSVRFMNSL